MSKRTVVCLIGSTRFSEAYRKANLDETLAGRIVLSIGCDTHSDQGLGLTPEAKGKLDALHLDKIDMADEVLVLNVGGYIGSSTGIELDYALENNKVVRYLEPVSVIVPYLYTEQELTDLLSKTSVTATLASSRHVAQVGLNLALLLRTRLAVAEARAAEMEGRYDRLTLDLQRVTEERDEGRRYANRLRGQLYSS